MKSIDEMDDDDLKQDLSDAVKTHDLVYALAIISELAPEELKLDVHSLQNELQVLQLKVEVLAGKVESAK